MTPADEADREVWFRFFIEITPDATVVVDESGTIRMVNSLAEDLFGYSKDEMVGNAIEMLVPEALRGGHPALRNAFIASASVRQMQSSNDLMAQTKSGELLAVSIGLSPMETSKDGQFVMASIRDNSALHQAHAAAEAYAKEVRNISDTANDAIITMNADSEILSWNPAATRNFGYVAADAVGQKIHLIIPEHLRQAHDEGIARVASGGGSTLIGNTVEVEGRRSNGDIFPVELSLATWTGESGTVFCGILRDITERKEGEKRLQDSEAQLRNILEKSRFGVSIVSIESNKRLYINPAMVDLFGAETLDEFVAMPLRSTYANPDDLEWLRSSTGKNFITEAEVERVRIDASRWWCMTNRLIIDYEGEEALMVWHYDITARKEAEIKVQKSEARLRNILESSPYGVSIVTDKTGERVYTNPTFNEMFGGDRNVSLARREITDSWVDPKDLNDFQQLASENDWHLDDEVLRKKMDGTPWWCLMSSRPVEYEGEPAHMVWHYDVTERKKAEVEVGVKEAQLRMAMENMPGAMVVVDPDLQIVLVNEAYAEFYGDPDGIVHVGKSIRDVIKSEVDRGILLGEGTPEEIVSERISSYRTDVTVTFEDKAPDGRYFHLTRTPAPDGHTVTVAIDITERKKAEKIIANAMVLINESIQYASRIQRSLLPEPGLLEDIFADHIVIWEPKDVVGGDIYLYRECDAGHLLMLADCTGHGVPGAFMTMIVTGALDQALIEVPTGDPAALLHRVNQLVKAVLGQDTDDGESDDGFECGLCLIDDAAKKITYAGARFELWSVKGGELTVIKGDKVGIGYRRTEIAYPFTNHVLSVGKDVCYYMASDGLVDQVGGKKRRAFGKRRLKKIIHDYSRMSMTIQAAHILRAFEEYQHGEVRRDDISLIGFKPNV